MIESGKLKATKIIDGKEKEVFQYSEGDYFGEISLMKNVPR